MALVFFDIDGTLVSGTSTERRFYRYLQSKGMLGARQFARYAISIPSSLLYFGRHALKKNKAYLCDLKVDELAAVAEDWVDTALDDAWYKPAIERLDEHCRRNDKVVLLSGTLDFLAQVIANRLGVADYIASTLPVDSGQILGETVVRHPFGREKWLLAEDFATQAGVSRDDVFAYADSIHDKKLLSWCGHPCVVNPDRKLAKVARARKWPRLN